MYTEQHDLYRFLNACGGSWRNTVFVRCDTCPYGNQHCGGHLLATDADGAPLLFSAALLAGFSRESIEPAECAGTLTRQGFEKLFSRWLLWNTKTGQQCSILQTLRRSKKDGNTD